MYISALSKSLPFSSPVVWSKPENRLDENMKYHINYFEYHPDRYQKLGEGKSASVHVLIPDQYVIKRIKSEKYPGYDRFENETEALSLLPDTFINSQHLVANTRTKDGSYFLVTTLQKGTPVNIFSMPLNTQRLTAILDSLLELDKAGIYHMDLSNNNILIHDNRANIIDYQWAKPFEPFKAAAENQKKGILFPEGIIPSNLQHYEETGFSAYLSKYMNIYGASQARTFLKQYLPLKGSYHRERADFYKKNLIQKGEYYLSDEESGEISHNKDYFNPLKFERALSKVYQEPNEDVVDVELLKLEVLRSHRKSYSFIDKNTDKTNLNMLNSAPYTINGIFAIKNYIYNLDKLEKKYENDKYMSRYLRYNKILANYWLENIKSWYPSILVYLSSLANGNEEDKLFPERNYIRYFSLTSFDSMLSQDVQRNNPQNISPKTLMPPQELVSQLEENINELQSISGTSNIEITHYYPEYHSYENPYANYSFILRDAINDIQEAYKQFRCAVLTAHPSDAFSSLLVLKNLYSQIIGINDMTALAKQEVEEKAKEGRYILNDIANTLIKNIVSTLSTDDKPICKNFDMSLGRIPRYKNETPQNKTFIDKLMDWWDNL